MPLVATPSYDDQGYVSLFLYAAGVLDVLFLRIIVIVLVCADG